jgi:hypothetical protein
VSTRLAGHGLRNEGMAFTVTGNAMPGFPSGPGCAKCECGALSEHVANRARRKAWHRAHKDEIRHGRPNLIRGGA